MDYTKISMFIFETLPTFCFQFITTLCGIVEWMFTDFTFEFLDNTVVFSPVEVIFGASAPLFFGLVLLKFLK